MRPSTLRGLGALAALLLFAGRASATSDPITTWTEGFGPGGRAPSAVTLGDHASQALVVYGGSNGFARLLSAYDTPTPTAVWSTASVYDLASVQAASAAGRDLHVLLTRERASSTASMQIVLRAYGSGSPVARWQSVFPLDASVSSAMGVACSPDGARVIAWTFDIWSFRTRLRVVQGDTGALIADQTLDSTGSPLGGALSPDGGYFLLTGPHSEILLETVGGTVVSQSSIAPTLGTARSLSATANRVATGRSDGTLQVYRRVAGTLTAWFQAPPPVSGSQYCAAGISADGSTLACASFSAAAPGNLRLEVFDLGQDSHPVVYSRTFPSTSSMARVTSLSISDDGGRVLATTNGDGTPTLPEVLSFERTAGVWSLAGSMLVGLPVWAASSSVDARRVALLCVGTTPPPQYLTLGEVLLIDSADRDLTGSGVPHQGASFTLLQHAPPGAGSRLLVSSSLAQPPQPFAGIGTLYLPQGQISVAGSGTANATGLITYGVTLPSGASAVGSHLEFQALRRAPRTLTHDFVHVTVLP